MDKRTFLKNASMAGLLMPFTFTRLDDLLSRYKGTSSADLARDEDFWSEIRSGFKLKSDYINLENGYYCFLPEETLEDFINHVRDVNRQGSWYMRKVQWENKKKIAAELAEMAGCTSEELIITRNTTEALDLVIGGLNWQAGDEAVMALQDYGAMLDQFTLMKDRYGVVNRQLSVPNHPKSDDELVELYASALTDKTRLLMICHMINITGHILPVRKICDMAHQRGVEVMVDGAHAFGHFDFSIDDLNCDYYGTSLHKWLSAPLGTGFLYVKQGKASNLWPLFAEEEMDPDDIYRLNHTGTHPVHNDLGILNAIEYHNKIGIERKEARLRFLQRYWTTKLRGQTRIIVNTPEDPARHCGIGNVGIEGFEPTDLAKMLLEKHKIWTVGIDRPGVKGLRITPNVYTTTDELDVFVSAMKELSAA